MTTKRVIIADNNITNSDWTKAKSFDFPGVETVEDFERVLDIPSNEPARSERLTQLAKLPWAKVAPKSVQKFLSVTQKQSLKKTRPQEKETSVPIPRKILPQGFETDTPTKGMTGGIVMFKGVPKPKKKPPTVTSADINSLAIRLRQHNAKSKPEQRTNLRDIKIVFLRGLEDGSHDEAKKRVIKFLSLMASDKPKDAKYSEDNDLLPLDHPWRNRKTKKKQVEFSEPEYGVKYEDGCCPKSVKRYHAL